MTEDIAAIKKNISQIQNGPPVGRHGEKQNCFADSYVVPENLRQNYTDSSAQYLNIDIKMETGTGKTYVYTKIKNFPQCIYLKNRLKLPLDKTFDFWQKFVFQD